MDGMEEAIAPSSEERWTHARGALPAARAGAAPGGTKKPITTALITTDIIRLEWAEQRVQKAVEDGRQEAGRDRGRAPW